jgi:asparagine synthetase B (glutamine-hydrolysing)
MELGETQLLVVVRDVMGIASLYLTRVAVHSAAIFYTSSLDPEMNGVSEDVSIK